MSEKLEDKWHVGKNLDQLTKEIHWARVLKEIKEAGPEGIAEYDLAEKFDREPGDHGLSLTLDRLKRQGKIRIALGRSKSTTEDEKEKDRLNMTCRVVQAIEDVPRRSKRDGT